MKASKIRRPDQEVRLKGAVKKQDRAIVTRKRLADAARQVFARDGFEQARVEDIAAAAGKTRGAFYANFKDKEDVFFAIFEEDLIRDREQVSLQLTAAASSEERVAAVARHMCEKIRNRPRMMLAVEFKQYAIRHPRKQKRLAELHRAMCATVMGTDLDTLLPEFVCTDPVRKRAQSSQLGAIIEGLALNCMFDPGGLTEKQLQHQLQVNLRVALDLE